MKKNIISAAVVLVVAVALGLFIYVWGFCRFYVPPEHMAVVTAKSGKTPAAATLLVEQGERGIWREVLPEGRYFLDPVMYDVKIVPAITIPIGNNHSHRQSRCGHQQSR